MGSWALTHCPGHIWEGKGETNAGRNRSKKREQADRRSRPTWPYGKRYLDQLSVRLIPLHVSIQIVIWRVSNWRLHEDHKGTRWNAQTAVLNVVAARGGSKIATAPGPLYTWRLPTLLLWKLCWVTTASHFGTNFSSDTDGPEAVSTPRSWPDPSTSPCSASLFGWKRNWDHVQPEDPSLP